MNYAMRHGGTQENVDKIIQGQAMNPLSRTGIKLVHAIAPRVKERNPKFLFSGDLLRHIQTSLILSNKLKLQIIIDKRLRERDWGGLTGTKYTGQPQSTLTEDVLKKHGVESNEELYNRVASFLTEIKNSEIDDALIVSSTGPIAMMDFVLNNADFDSEKFMESFLSLDNSSLLELGKNQTSIIPLLQK